MHHALALYFVTLVLAALPNARGISDAPSAEECAVYGWALRTTPAIVVDVVEGDVRAEAMEARVRELGAAVDWFVVVSGAWADVGVWRHEHVEVVPTAANASGAVRVAVELLGATRPGATRVVLLASHEAQEAPDVRAVARAKWCDVPESRYAVHLGRKWKLMWRRWVAPRDEDLSRRPGAWVWGSVAAFRAWPWGTGASSESGARAEQ